MLRVVITDTMGRAMGIETRGAKPIFEADHSPKGEASGTAPTIVTLELLTLERIAALESRRARASARSGIELARRAQLLALLYKPGGYSDVDPADGME